MENKKLFKKILHVSNIPEDVFNKKQAGSLLFIYIFLVVLFYFFVKYFNAYFLSDYNQIAFVLNFILPIVLTVIISVLFKIESKIHYKWAFLDKLLTAYSPNNIDAYEELIRLTKAEPRSFPQYFEDWIAIESQSYEEYQIKEKSYQFTEPKRQNNSIKK